ncbi:MAG TPA: hypothetical protein VGL02_26065 [Streptomyces sp.]
MNSNAPGPAWTITDPSAPPRPKAFADRVPETARSRPVSVRGFLWPVPLPSRGTVCVLVSASLSVLIVPHIVARLLTAFLGGVVGWNVQVSPTGVSVAAVLTLAVLLVGPLALMLLRCFQSARARRHSRRSRTAAAAARDQERNWREQYQLERGQLPDGEIRAAADRLIAASTAIESSRARREGWVKDGSARTLQARQWSLLTRERDSAAVRAQLAEAAQLAEDTPQLAEVVRIRTAELAALDAELAQLADEAAQVQEQLRALDAALAAADEARSSRERADVLAQQLGAAPLTVEDVDAAQRRLRDQVLAEGSAENDLTILAAQLGALTQHIAGDIAAARPN